MRILLVEDDRSLQRTLVKLLKTQNFAVDATAFGKEAVFLAKTNDYDVIVLDLMLPDIDGFEVCKQIRREKLPTPILMLTALDEVDNRIKGLDTGADDYLPKPFHAGELLARIRALTRRVLDDKTSVLKIHDIELDTAARKAFRNGKDLKLSGKELALLEYLMANRNKIVTRGEIAEHVWDLNFDPRSNVIDAFIKLLRKKVDAGSKQGFIKTVRGVGYTMSDEG
ncbi:MAG: response regulator transcription factor [Bacteroidetes bacterium]|nr:response regulator transcription factor [Bacteroidota bacterium]MCL5737883.1 response regulator transcription factor [Bacteroidota bacterium]